MEVLSLESLPLVRDGAVRELFDAEMKKVYRDLDDRPHVKTARTITMKITIAPEAESKTSKTSHLEGVFVGFSIASSVPAQSFGRPMKANHKKGGIVFEPDTDSTVPSEGQKTIDE